MASRDYPYLYRDSHGDAVRQHEEDLWEHSFRENVCCARAIERVLRENTENSDHIPDGCPKPVLEEYGFKRVTFVLAHTITELSEIPALREMLSDSARSWAESFRIKTDTAYDRYFHVDAAIQPLNEIAQQVREAYQALALFERAHCSAGMYDANVEGKVLVLSADALKESAWSRENQLWLATGGFGCDPKAGGRAIYATCLGDGEQTRWNREDFCGVLDEQYLPDWAREKLEQVLKPHTAPAMSAMEMG